MVVVCVVCARCFEVSLDLLNASRVKSNEISLDLTISNGTYLPIY
jgi:uncharacterized membrane protein